MPGGNKNSGSQTSYSSQPGVSDILGPAKSIMNSGTAWKPNTTSQVTPFSRQTRTGLTGMQHNAQGATPAFHANFGRVNATLGDGGLNDLQDQQVGRLQSQASGGMLQNNPYLDEVINRTSQDIGNASNLAASAAGRYGSGAHQGVTQDAVGDMSAKLRYDDYGRERGYMQDAIGSLFNAGTTQRNNILGGTQQLQSAYDATNDPSRTMLGVGSAFENKNSQVLADQDRIFREKQNAITAPVNWGANLFSAYNGGTQIQNQYQPSGGLAGGLGGALAGYDIFGGPLGGLAGGLGGAFL